MWKAKRPPFRQPKNLVVSIEKLQPGSIIDPIRRTKKGPVGPPEAVRRHEGFAQGFDQRARVVRRMGLGGKFGATTAKPLKRPALASNAAIRREVSPA
jgi:hypothetical protein